MENFKSKNIANPDTVIRQCLSATKFFLLSFFVSCAEEPTSTASKEIIDDRIPLAELILPEEYWEGSSTEFEETFYSKKDGFEEILCRKVGDSPFSGLIKIRARTGSVAELKSYWYGKPHGDFFEWHENGNLKSKSQFKNGMKHGYFYVWTKNGVIYSRKFYQEDLEDFGRFKDQGASESGKSLAAVELEEWEGNGGEFYQKFAGDPKRGGMIHIRETEELYTGTITAMDDKGRKEAVLRFSKGKYHGTISKWNDAGSLWEEAEFDRGELVGFTTKNGKPFDATQVIDLSKDPSSIEMLFND
jgi:antitoxin component YwqK of YwqJK toxin-antitoxin module